jgi:hypothetical protein
MLRLRSSLLAGLMVGARGFPPPIEKWLDEQQANDEWSTEPPYLSWTEGQQPPMVILDHTELPSNTKNADAQSSPIPWENYKPFRGFMEIWNGLPEGFEISPSPFPSPSPQAPLFKIPDIDNDAYKYYESYYDYDYLGSLYL